MLRPYPDPRPGKAAAATTPTAHPTTRPGWGQQGRRAKGKPLGQLLVVVFTIYSVQNAHKLRHGQSSCQLHWHMAQITCSLWGAQTVQPCHLIWWRFWPREMRSWRKGSRQKKTQHRTTQGPRNPANRLVGMVRRRMPAGLACLQSMARVALQGRNQQC